MPACWAGVVGVGWGKDAILVGGVGVLVAVLKFPEFPEPGNIWVGPLPVNGTVGARGVGVTDCVRAARRRCSARRFARAMTDVGLKRGNGGALAAGVSGAAGVGMVGAFATCVGVFAGVVTGGFSVLGKGKGSVCPPVFAVEFDICPDVGLIDVWPSVVVFPFPAGAAATLSELGDTEPCVPGTVGGGGNGKGNGSMPTGGSTLGAGATAGGGVLGFSSVGTSFSGSSV